jgi:hypothetical protein
MRRPDSAGICINEKQGTLSLIKFGHQAFAYRNKWGKTAMNL